MIFAQVSRKVLGFHRDGIGFHPEPGSGLAEASFRRRQLPDAKSQLAPGGVQGGHSRPRFARAKRMDVSTRRRADRKGRGVAKISVNALTSFISGIPRRTGRLHGIVGKSRNQQLKRTEALFERAIATSRSGQSANSPGQGSCRRTRPRPRTTWVSRSSRFYSDEPEDLRSPRFDERSLQDAPRVRSTLSSLCKPTNFCELGQDSCASCAFCMRCHSNERRIGK